MSSPICSLSSKGEGKPPPQVSEGSKETEEPGESEACPLHECRWRVPGRGQLGCWVVLSLPWVPGIDCITQSGGGSSPGCEGSVPCRAVPAAVPRLHSAQVQRGDGHTPEFSCWGAGQGQGGRSPEQVLVHDSKVPKCYGHYYYRQ